MYRGVSRLLGMQIVKAEDGPEPEIAALEKCWGQFDFFYLHIKKIDSYGEDGNQEAKVELIEEVDAQLPRIMDLHPDVLLVTGDHSTPSPLSAHSWHPVPVLLWSRRTRPDGVSAFGERSCITGGLGARFPATDLLPLTLAHAGRLEKFGA
jgi:2,3-bisphosphoglycerate-independent phosphoglycerate mutase